MAQVTVTYNAWDHNRDVIPPSRKPRVGFRPITPTSASGLMTSREVWGSLDPNTGAGSVKLESAPGIRYVPFMDWLTGPATSENDRLGYCEWAPINPASGGRIEDLVDLTPYGPIVAALGAPPAGTTGVAWIDLTDLNDKGVMVYAPERAV